MQKLLYDVIILMKRNFYCHENTFLRYTLMCVKHCFIIRRASGIIGVKVALIILFIA